MSERIWEDLAEMKKKLSFYVDKGRVTGYMEVKEEPVVAVKPDVSKIRPLKKVSSYGGQFLAVDCSTRTLKRANNWGIYLMRTAYTSVEGRNVNWDYMERMCTVVGDAYTRSSNKVPTFFVMEQRGILAHCQEADSSFFTLIV